MYKEIELNPYIPSQIKLEEEYYDELMDVYLVLLTMFQNSLKDGMNKFMLMKQFNSWLAQNSSKIAYINAKYANKMVKLVVNEALKGEIELDQIRQKSIANIITQDLNINQQFLNNSVAGRFVTAIPTGAILATGLITSLIPEDEAIEELITRGTNSIEKFVQFNVSQGTGDLIAAISQGDGYNQYLAGNEEDDRVRELHREQNDFKTWRDFDNPPSTGLPGTQPRCRCNILKIRKKA